MNIIDQRLDGLHTGQVAHFSSVVSNDYRKANSTGNMKSIRKLIKACTLEGAPRLENRLALFYSANLITQNQLNKLDEELRQHLENIKC